MPASPRPSIDEILDALIRRSVVLECLADGPKYNRDIREAVGISRSTVYKSVSELEELDIVRRGENGYELTLAGQLLYEQFRRFEDSVGDICAASRLLSVLPGSIDIPVALLEDASVTVSERHAPNRPVREVEDLVESAAVVRGTGPVVLPTYVEIFSSRLSEAMLEATLVFERPAFDHLTSEYETELRTAVESESVDIWVTDAELPYALLVVEQPSAEVCLVVYDSSGDLEGTIRSDRDEAVSWGLTQFEQVRERASRVRPEWS